MKEYNIQIVNTNGGESSKLYPVSKAKNIKVDETTGFPKNENINNVSDGLKYILDNMGSEYDDATASSSGLMSAEDKIKLDGISSGATSITSAYGICNTSAVTAEKVVTLAEGSEWILKPGNIIAVQFKNTNTATNPTLNVNNTGAKSVSYFGSVIGESDITYAGYAGRIHIYMYDGTNYVYIGDNVDKNAGLGQGYGTCLGNSLTTLKTVNIPSYELIEGGIVVVNFKNEVSQPSCTLNINGKGAKPIYYRGSGLTSGIIKNGDTATFIYSNSVYHLISIDRDVDTTYENATTSTAGLMSAADKTKLDGIASGANNYTLPSATSSTLGGVTIGNNISVSSGTISLSKNNVISALGYTPPTTDTTYSAMTAPTSTAAGKAGLVPSPPIGANTKFLRGDGTWQLPTGATYENATTSTAGLMSAADKAKLDGITSGSGNYTLPSATSSTLGGVTIGSNITVSSGTISLSSTNVTTALGYTPLNSNLKGANSGLAELDENGKVPASQLPSYVDDVLEYTAKSTFPTTGETGKIYIDISTNKTYRWSGSVYAEITASIALGETSSTAYRGDRGKTAYDHATTTETNPHGTTKSDVGLGNVTNNAQVKGLASGTTSGHVVTWGSDGYTVVDSGYTIATSVPSGAKFTDTTYSAMTAPTSTAAGKAGLVPSPPAGANNKFLRGDGTWQLPTGATYNNATTSTAGLMSAADKTKLDGIASGANAYSLPNATSSTLGGVKVGSNITVSSGTISLSKNNVTSALGYTPPTTNTTYSNFVKSGSGAAAGLVPAPSTTAGTTKYLREDGTWQNPMEIAGTLSAYIID